jgi:hypothetical protein
MAIQQISEEAVKIVYKSVPFYANIWFYLMIFAFLTTGMYALIMYIINRQRNRLVVRVVYPDATFDSYVYHKFNGDKFLIPTKDKTSEGKYENFSYIFHKLAIYRGEWGRYIEYDYKNPLPKNPLKHFIDTEDKKPDIIRLLVSLTETSIFTNLLLSSKFKDFVIIMLWIILGISILSLIGQFAIPQFMEKDVYCNLIPSNQTLAVIRSALIPQ